MKKIIAKIAVCVMALLMVVGAVGCKKPEWAGTNMKNWGAIYDYSADGGFIGETQNYYYVINGVADNTNDNTFGAPVKGALVAIDKTDFSKVEVVVPKLFAAGDYNAGVYIFGDETNGYVYYGTPSTAKNNAGSIANNELTFMRTKLDGSETNEFFTVDNLAIEYRFVKQGDKVYLVYYAEADTALKCYDTMTGETTVIAKTDDKTNVKTDGEYQTLASYNFTESGDIIFTTTVFNGEYFEANPSARGKKAYNRVYKYKAGDAVNGAFAGTIIKDGKGENETENKTYAVTLATEDYIFYTETDYLSNATTYAVEATASDWTSAQKIEQADLVVDTTLIISLTEAYYLKDGTVYKTDLTKKNKDAVEPVAKSKNISQLLFVEGEDIYFLNAEGLVARLKLKDAEAKEVVVTDVAIATTWYKYEIITDGTNKYLAYCDGTDVSATYLRYVKLSGEVGEKDLDDDDENDYFYLKGNEVLGKMLPEHEAQVATKKIDAIGTTALSYEKIGGNITVETVEEARKAYDKLSSSAKDLVSAETLAKLTNAEKAVDAIKVFVKLESLRNHGILSPDQLADIEAIYDNEAKTFVNGLGDNKKAVLALVPNELNWCYQKAGDLFDAE